MSGDPNRHRDDDHDNRDDEPPNETESGVLVLATGDRGAVFVGAVLIRISSHSALHTLAVRAAGSFSDGGSLGTLLTLLVFATGVVSLVEGAASLVAKKNADS
ncbi:hypothetical protein KU306_06985 [Haloferax larsenii]|uniref:Uncharacterized protein n=1 Tax=Haloferax larsenii TaxID=302484 RepID=A0ABY5RGX1_HALLR|nr:hypothetical protein [Haloferax larsenii]UVE51614.1 hypothetical protein KU306_06985 [Haloferax larsenii]